VCALDDFRTPSDKQQPPSPLIPGLVLTSSPRNQALSRKRAREYPAKSALYPYPSPIHGRGIEGEGGSVFGKVLCTWGNGSNRSDDAMFRCSPETRDETTKKKWGQAYTLHLRISVRNISSFAARPLILCHQFPTAKNPTPKATPIP